MLPNSRKIGLELLERMAQAAAQRAALQLLRPFQLTHCVMVELRPGLAAEDVRLESWAVQGDARGVTISVFATAAVPAAMDQAAADRMAGTGRFTFATLPHTLKDLPA